MRRPPRRVEVHGAGKVNVGWLVGDRRNDGYHDVSGLMQTVSLLDVLDITVDPGIDGLEVAVPGRPELENDSNLVVVAARLLSDRIDPLPTRIVVHKTIPIAAGLGGGSADAAAALVGLNTVWGGKLHARDLVEIAAEVGSDVPGILVGGLVHASGRGERVRNVGSFDDGWLVLGVGADGISAAAAYKAFDDLGSEIGDAGAHAFFHNDLERAACRLVDGLAERVEAMREATGSAWVSGSGPTVVGPVADEAHARGCAARVRDHFHDVLIARPTTWGVRLHLRGGA